MHYPPIRHLINPSIADSYVCYTNRLLPLNFPIMKTIRNYLVNHSNQNKKLCKEIEREVPKCPYKSWSFYKPNNSGSLCLTPIYREDKDLVCGRCGTVDIHKIFNDFHIGETTFLCKKCTPTKNNPDDSCQSLGGFENVEHRATLASNYLPIETHNEIYEYLEEVRSNSSGSDRDTDTDSDSGNEFTDDEEDEYDEEEYEEYVFA